MTPLIFSDPCGGVKCHSGLCLYSGIFHGCWRSRSGNCDLTGGIRGALCDPYQKTFPDPSGGTQTF